MHILSQRYASSKCSNLCTCHVNFRSRRLSVALAIPIFLLRINGIIDIYHLFRKIHISGLILEVQIFVCSALSYRTPQVTAHHPRTDGFPRKFYCFRSPSYLLLRNVKLAGKLCAIIILPHVGVKKRMANSKSSHADLQVMS